MKMRNTYIDGWDNYALPHPFKAEALRLEKQFETDTYKDSNYVLRWKSNNAVPPQEVLDFWKHVGKRFNMSKSVAAREKENREFLEVYRRSQKNRKMTCEERYELEAAFGKGTTVVDVITGRKTKL